MTRKDSEKDSERPHYYSQFWLDIAAGRRTIGGPRPDEEGAEPELAEPAPSSIRRPTRSASYEDPNDGHVDGRGERFPHHVAEPLVTPEEFEEPDAEEVDLETADVDGLDLPEETVDDIDIPDMDLTPVEEDSEEDEEDSEEDEEAVEGEEEEEEEDDIGWGGTAARGRKRNKPVRPKLPPKKAPRREPRRGY